MGEPCAHHVHTVKSATSGRNRRERNNASRSGRFREGGGGDERSFLGGRGDKNLAFLKLFVKL